ncbi:MAG: hypothetical protein R3331_12095 [Sulfurospirillaceae bacterium]|nr:hypothetical protein [Sulfurospirillaceae bacterium]
MEWLIFGVFVASLYFYFNRKKSKSGQEIKEDGAEIKDTTEN